MLKTLLDFLEHQQFLAGVIGLAVTGGLMFALRSVPMAIWNGMRELFSTVLVVESNDEAYNHLAVWLARSEHVKNARRLMLVQAYDQDKGTWKAQITLGVGWHLLWVSGRPLLIHRHIQPPDAASMSYTRRPERLTIVTLGAQHAELSRVIDEAGACYKGEDLMNVLFWANGSYQTADTRLARTLDTVFLPHEQKNRLVSDLQAFTSSREAYRKRGVPWRRGYLLEGPPGTGKTTLINVLAAHVNRSIYVLNLDSLISDNELIAAVNEVKIDGVLVIEDIDGIAISHDREQASTGASKAGVTLSGLLNAIDGVTAREGRILFFTSNRPECLDPALLRAGRVDVREKIEPLNRAQALEMHQAFRPGSHPAELDLLVAGNWPIAAADLQNLLIGLGNQSCVFLEDYEEEAA